MRAGPLVIPLSLLLAGCAATEASSPGPQAAPATASAGSAAIPDAGSIFGRVLNEESLPVQGAVIGIKENGVEASTDEGGEFRIINLSPGPYTIIAARLGFESIAKRVDVLANQEIEVLFLLRVIAVAEAFKDIQPKNILIDAGIGWSVGGDSGHGCIYPAVTCQSVAYPGANTPFAAKDPAETPLAFIVLEGKWTANSAVCAKTVRLRIYSPGSNTGNPSATNPGHWTNDPHPSWVITSPIMMRIPRADDGTLDSIENKTREGYNGDSALTIKGTWTARTFPPGRGLTNLPADINCFTQQRIDLWFTAFYLDPAPTDYTALRDA